MPFYDGHYTPEEALDYVVARNIKVNTTSLSGGLGALAGEVGAGFTHISPQWAPLQGDFTDNTTGNPVDRTAFESMLFVYPILSVEKQWGQEALIGEITEGGIDANTAAKMLNSVSEFTAREINRFVLWAAQAATIGMDTPEIPTVIPVSDNAIALDMFIDLMGLYGERGSEVDAWWMHSDMRTYLDKVNLLTNGAAYEGQYAPYGTIMGRPVMIDDTMTPEIVDPSEGLIYPVLATTGQFAGYGDGSSPYRLLEQDRDTDNDIDTITTRQRMGISIHGAQFTQVLTAPCLIEDLYNADNYASGYDGIDMGGYPFRTALLLARLVDITPP